MTEFMDIRFPEFPAPRDTGTESASRKDRAGNSDFAEMLDRSLDEPQDKPREVANEKPAARPVTERSDADAAPADAETARDRTVETQTDSADATAPANAEAPPAQAEKPLEIANDAAGDSPVAAMTADTQVAAPPPQPTAPLLPAPALPIGAPSAKPEQTPQPAPAQAATPAPAPAAAVDGGAAPVVPQAAADKTTGQPDFTSELAAAAASPAEPVAAKSKATSKPEPKSVPAENAAPPDATQTVTVAAVQQTKAAPDALPRDARSPGAEPAPAKQDTANPQPAIPPAIAGDAGTKQAATEAADDAQIVALVRPANVPATDRPAVSQETVQRTDPTAGPTAKDPLLEAKGPEQTKAEAPSRPFGAVAPGLSVAAQIVAQQTPEQANAAERLAQLASAAESQTTIAPDHEAGDVVKNAEAGAPASRTDQLGQIDHATQRQAATDVGALAAAARSARPAAHPMITQIAAHVAQAAIDGNDRINIRLSPAELGRIDVKLEFGPDGRVQAVFAADRAQTVDLLQRDARDLERALQDAGLRADSGSLSFNLRGDGRNGAQDGPGGNANHDEAVVELNNPQLQAYAAGGGASGRLDLRI
jgi:flagellar hook-length control protein FliK